MTHQFFESVTDPTISENKLQTRSHRARTFNVNESLHGIVKDEIIERDTRHTPFRKFASHWKWALVRLNVVRQVVVVQLERRRVL